MKREACLKTSEGGPIKKSLIENFDSSLIDELNL
jgi:hypothetical protein